MSRLSQAVAMGVGVSGAMVDVSSYVDLEAGVSRSWGRQSEFEDAAPGTFSFTLDNNDGRFTPGNTSSPLSTTVTEGMSVCWKLDNGSQSRLVAGTIQSIEPAFPGGQSGWAQVRITCDDMLGNAGRRSIGKLTDALFDVASGIAVWDMAYPEGTTSAFSSRGNTNLTVKFGDNITFGVTSSNIPVESSVAAVTAGSAYAVRGGGTPASAYTTGTFGGWGLWVERASELSVFHANFEFPLLFGGGPISVVATPTSTYLTPGAGTSIVAAPLSAGTAHYLSYSTSITGTFPSLSMTVEFFIDGASIGTSTYSGGTMYPYSAAVQYIELPPRTGSLWVETSFVSRIAHSLSPIDETAAGPTTPQDRLAAVAATTPEITLDTLPTTLSPALLGPFTESNSSAFDEITNFVRAEQGHVYTTTTGTLTSPVQKVKLRSRERPATVSYSFNAETEASAPTNFVRDITNMVYRVTADGAGASAVYSDSTLFARVGSKDTTESLPLSEYTHVYTWATDRIYRGANVALRVADLTVDAFTTPTDRSADLFALVPGDRIRITGLPSTQLGFSTWDGWLIGVSEKHDIRSHEFTMHLSPTLPTPGIYDTDYWAADGALTLSSAIATTGATSMSVATTGPKLETSAVPYDLLIDAERVTVTACTGATPQVATITRGVGGTTPATHTTSAVIEYPTTATYGF